MSVNKKWAMIVLGAPSYRVCNEETRFVMEFATLPKPTLQEAAIVFWQVAQALRNITLQGGVVENVAIVASGAKNLNAFSDLVLHAPVFKKYIDWHELASYTEWSAPTSTFLRLATLTKILPEVCSVLDMSKLIDKSLADNLVWTHWLINHHVNFQHRW